MQPVETSDPIKFLAQGTRWSDRIAPLAFPILLAAAAGGTPLSYKQLAEKLHDLHGEPVPKSFRNYGGPSGKIGDALEMLSKLWVDEEIPPLSAIVINSSTGLPGEGAYWFISRYLGNRKISKADHEACAATALDRIFNYANWNKVADFFGIDLDGTHQIEPIEKPILLPDPTLHSGGYPESEGHKRLKEWVRVHPQVVEKTFGKFAPGRCEQTIQSGDRLDVYFENALTKLAVEVKAANVQNSEYFRGIFQCVKYRAVLRATQLAEGELPNAQAALVVERSLPLGAIRLAKRLQVTTYVVEQT